VYFVRSVAFLVAECNEVLSGYRPGQVVEKTNVSKTIFVLVLKVLLWIW
jgi:hypothetical protein